MTRPFRIVLVSFYPADPTRIAGGIRAVAYLLVEGLRRHADVEVHVVHCHSDIATSHTVNQGNVTLHYLALPRQRIIPNMMTGVRQIAAQIRAIEPDVVNAHGHSYAVAALRAGIDPIWTIHGVVAEEAHYNPGLFNRLAFALAGHYERQALARVSTITAISPYIQATFAGRTRARWYLTENPAPDDMFALPRRPVPGRLLLPASVIPRKDPVTLIRALALARRELPHLHLQIAGRTNEAAYLQTAQAACQELGLTGQVTFLGMQGQADMRRLYSEAELVVLSSREEVSPMSAIEALAAGIPVVTTRAGGAGNIVADGCTGYVVDVGDAPALARAICRALADRSEYDRMSCAARAAAEERFRLDRVAERYLEIYRARSGL
jgi:glycosyltransferase involved in cell wall biosynthesis